jgi:hypothetical protein
MNELNKNDLGVILDVLNVYNPADISHVYPKMGEKEFLDGVKEAFEKVLGMLEQEKRKGNKNSERYYFHPEEVANRKWCEENKAN